MDWGKIAIANAINPGLGVMEYNRQHEKKQKQNYWKWSWFPE